MARTIVLPSELEKKLTGLASLREEVDGILLYRPRENLCPIEAIFMTGVGNEGHVQAQPSRVEIANEFLKRNPDYRFIKFHTHSRGTIQKHGAYYARNFSSRDIAVLQEQLKQDPAYIALLVTPATKVVYGRDSPNVETVPNFPRYVQRGLAVHESLQRIARNLGYDLDTLKATRKPL